MKLTDSPPPRPAVVWGVLWGVDLLLWFAGAWWVGLLGLLAVLGAWGTAAVWAPEFDCPRCSGRNRTPGIVGWLFGGHRRGCRGARAWGAWRKCRGGQRIRLGTWILAPAKARDLAGWPK